MASKPTPPDDAPPDDELVAYLDGELEGAAAEALEARLAADPAARTRAEQLRKTYDLLEYLPQPEPSANFASRTLTQIHPNVSGAAPANGMTATYIAAPRNRWLTLGSWFAAAIVAAVLGFLGHLLARPHLEKKSPPPTVQQVRLLERLPLYAGVDDLTYLKALDEQDLFGDPDHEPSTTIIMTQPGSSASLTQLEEAFKNLPITRQDQLRKLDEDFFALDPAERERLQGTLERYASWLDGLRPDQRGEVLKAPAPPERLEAVRRIKKRIWREHLPLSVKARVAEAADVEERDRIYADYRRQEAERRQLWDAARRQWANLDSTSKPYPFDDAELTQQVEDYLNVVLKPRLRADEIARLEEMKKQTANGRYGAWYLYGVQLLISAETHPSLPEPKTGKPITKVDDLPADFLRRLRTPGPKPLPMKRELKDLPQHGKWPEFAEVIAREAQDRGLTLPVPLGPNRPGEFKPEVEEVLTALKVKLTSKEKSDLESLHGKWPAYPRKFLDLARLHDMSVPGVTLPGAPSLWAKTYGYKGLRRP